MVLTWIFGIVGVLGIGGTIAALVFAPAVAIPIVQSVVTRLMACKPCLYAIAIIAACSASWWFGHHQAVLDCRAADLAAELRNREIDLENASKARSDETERANKIEGDSSEQHTKDIKEIADLKKRPPTCIFDATDAGVPDDKSGASNSQPPATANKIGADISGPVPHKRLLLPMVRNSWLPWRGRKSDAAPHQ